jgi:hypothetical protein
VEQSVAGHPWRYTMRSTGIRTLGALIVLIAFALGVLVPAHAQDSPEVYTAMLIASEAVAGSGAGRINIRIVSYTSDTERTNLMDAFKKSEGEGLALLRTLTKGYINIEGQSGRKIYAVFSRQRKDGHEVIIIAEHVASKLERWRDVKPEEHPLAAIHLVFNESGTPVKGEVFPAVKVSVTSDGFVDAQTDSSNKVTMVDLARK